MMLKEISECSEENQFVDKKGVCMVKYGVIFNWALSICPETVHGSSFLSTRRGIQTMREGGIEIMSPISYIHLGLMPSHSGPLKAAILLGKQTQPSLYSKQRCESIKQDGIWCL